jgi:hypothetical protein
MRLPKEKIVFIVDTIPVGPARRPPRHQAGRQNILTLMQEASAEIKKQAQEGKCWDAVEKEFKLPNYANWPGYENGLPFIARRYCALWGRGT